MPKVVTYNVPASVERDETGAPTLKLKEQERTLLKGEDEEISLSDLLSKASEVSTLNDDAMEMARHALGKTEQKREINVRLKYIQ
jgi:hypothetical protein